MFTRLFEKAFKRLQQGKRKGKSGGARVITCLKIVDNRIYLVAIYDKSEKETISNKELRERIKPFSL